MYSRLSLEHNHKKNIQIASTLSFVAGFINTTGILSFKILTTNVTGHFAYFAEETAYSNFFGSLYFILYVFSFFIGSFTANTIVEYLYQSSQKYYYYIPILLESFLVYSVIYFWHSNTLSLEFQASILLFAMGMQNSLVTKISNSVVRTTHLTGLFTDLGIDLSQLIFEKNTEKRSFVKMNIQIKSTIVIFFFAGGLSGGILYHWFDLRTLSLPASILILSVAWDYLRNFPANFFNKTGISE